MANDLGIVEANPSVSILDLYKRQIGNISNLSIPGAISNVAGRMAGGESLPVAIGSNIRNTAKNIFDVGRDAVAKVGEFAGGVKQGLMGNDAPVVTPAPSVLTKKPVVSTPVAPVTPGAIPTTAGMTPAPTPSPFTVAPSAEQMGPPKNFFQATLTQPTGTINGASANVQPVPVAASALPAQVQKDMASVGAAAPVGTTVLANAPPGETRSLLSGPYIDKATGQMMPGIGAPSSVVSYPEGTGPTRPAPLTEEQIQNNRNVFSRAMGDSAILKPTALEQATLARYRGPNYNPALGMQRPDVRRSILANEKADTEMARGETMADKDVIRKKTLFQAQGEIARGIEQEKGKTATAVGEAQERIRQSAMTEREKFLASQGVLKRDASANVRSMSEINKDYRDAVSQFEKDKLIGNTDESLRNMIPVVDEAIKAGHASAQGGVNSPMVKKLMLMAEARAKELAKNPNDAKAITAISNALVQYGGDVDLLPAQIKALLKVS